VATFVFFDEFKPNVTSGAINLATHTLAVALSNTAPNAATMDELADITQITAANGYSAGGSDLASGAWAETGAGTGIWRYTSAQEVFTASGGSIGPFRYVILYSNTSTGDKLIGYLDYGSSISITDGNTFTVEDVDTTGWFDLEG
jgi:hypothetical protein